MGRRRRAVPVRRAVPRASVPRRPPLGRCPGRFVHPLCGLGSEVSRAASPPGVSNPPLLGYGLLGMVWDSTVMQRPDRPLPDAGLHLWFEPLEEEVGFLLVSQED